MRKIYIVFFLILFLVAGTTSHAATVFSDNFDSITDGWNCSDDIPAGWNNLSACGSASYSGVTHYGGEITSGGRTGNSLKSWKQGQFPGDSVYSGLLDYVFSSDTYRNIYTRWYMKIPTGFNMTTFDYLKLWRWNFGSGGSYNKEIYLNFNGDGGTWSSAQVQVYKSNGDGQWATMLNTTDLPKDGEWHCYEWRVQLNTTGSSDGVLQFWLDGVLKYSSTAVNFGSTSTEYLQKTSIGTGNRNGDPLSAFQTGWQAIEFDDYILSTTYVGPDGTPGNNAPTVTITTNGGSGAGVDFTTANTTTALAGTSSDSDGTVSSVTWACPTCTPTSGTAGGTVASWTVASIGLATGANTITVTATDDDAATGTDSIIVTRSGSGVVTLFSEGFDDTSMSDRGWFDNPTIVVDTSVKYAGAGSVRFTWTAGNQGSFGTSRRDFTATDNLYSSFYWRFNTDWVGSGESYHPHFFYILSDRDDHWGGLAANYLDTYIEPHGTGAFLILQDLLNSPAVCGSGCFYTPSITFAKNQWYHVETYFKMNTLTGSTANSDGVMKMWVDGNLVYNSTTTIFRNSQNPTLKWATWVIAPYIGDGSPQNQTMWLDELTVGIGEPYTSGDTTAPTVTTKTIAANGTTLTLAFDETVSIGAGGNGGWTISPSGGAATLTYSSGSGSSSLVYTISRPIQFNETATVSYTQPTNGDGVEDTAGNDLLDITASSVTNSSTQGQDTTPAAFTFTDVTGATRSTQYTALTQIIGINTGITCTGSGGTVAACTGGTEGTCGTFGSTSGTITNNQYVAARVTSSASYSTPANNLVTCGGVSDTYSVTTLADPGDVTAPTVTSASVNGSIATINFSETVVTTGYDTGDFNLDCTSPTLTDVALSSPSGTGASRTFTIATPIVYGQVCNLDYVGSTNDIEDVAGNDMIAFSNMAVTNNTPQVGAGSSSSHRAIGIIYRGIRVTGPN